MTGRRALSPGGGTLCSTIGAILLSQCFVPKVGRLHRSITNAVPRPIDPCCERHGRIRGRFPPVRKWGSARPAKFTDQFPDRRPSTTERFHQPFQIDPAALIPLVGNLGSALPNGVSIHLLCPTECWLK